MVHSVLWRLTIGTDLPMVAVTGDGIYEAELMPTMDVSLVWHLEIRCRSAIIVGEFISVIFFISLLLGASLLRDGDRETCTARSLLDKWRIIEANEGEDYAWW